MGGSVWPFLAENAIFGKCSDWLETPLKRCASTRAFEWCNRRVIWWPTKVMTKILSTYRVTKSAITAIALRSRSRYCVRKAQSSRTAIAVRYFLDRQTPSGLSGPDQAKFGQAKSVKLGKTLPFSIVSVRGVSYQYLPYTVLVSGIII